MSNVLKSKSFLGVMIVAAVIVAFAIAGVASAAYFHTVTLKMGVTSSQVLSLQQTLNASGFLVASVGDGSPGMETMYFGAKTKAAVMAFQASRGLVADGIVGPATGAALGGVVSVGGSFPAGCTSAAGFSVTTGLPCSGGSTLPAGCLPGFAFSSTTGLSCTGGSTPTTSGPLAGGAGSANYTLLSEFASEEVGEDEADVEVAGLEIEAENSDLELTALRLVFVQGTAGSDFEDYADEVSVWLDGEEIGRVDGDKFNDGNSYTSTITLAGGIVREDDKENLVVAVSGVNNLDTADAGDTWTVDFRSVRYTDALGDSTSEDPGTATKTFSFESFATAASSRLDMRLTTGTAADKINKAHLINAHLTDENELKGVPLLEFTMEAEGDSDLEIRDFGVNVVVVSAPDVDDIIAGGTVATTGGSPEIFLEIEGQRYGTAGYNEAAAVTREIAFTDVDYTIDAGDTVTARIVANLNALDTDADAGDTIRAEILETQSDDTALFDVRDESGTQILDADIVGTPTGIASTLRDTGFDLEFVSADADITYTGDAAVAGDDDRGTFEIVFNVVAWDDNATAIFLDAGNPLDDDGEEEVQVDFNAAVTDFATDIARTGGAASVEDDAFEILAGDSVEFTLTYTAAPDADGSFFMTLSELWYALTDVDGDLVVLDAQIELTDSFKTPSIALNFD